MNPAKGEDEDEKNVIFVGSLFIVVLRNSWSN
jgi:hypothetical protein